MILEVLNNLGVGYVATNNPAEYKMNCCSGLHLDNDPSLRFNIEKGMFHCFSCGFGGSIKELLSTLGYSYASTYEKTINLDYKVRKLLDKIRLLKADNLVKMPLISTMYNAPFKGIDAEVIKEFEGFITEDWGLDEFLSFPIYQNSNLRFIESRRRLSDDQPKYLRNPTNVVTTDILFPFDKIIDKQEIILVEGLFDMLNVWQHGYKNVVCIFGTSNFGNRKVEILKNVGCKKVHIMMDGDNAGYIASERIFNLLDKFDIESRIVKLNPGKDPGELSQQELKGYI